MGCNIGKNIRKKKAITYKRKIKKKSVFDNIKTV